MRERVEQLVGGVSRLMWVMTFHSACARILRSDAERLGYKRAFTIYDQADSLRMVKRCMEEFEVDPKRFPPRAVQSQISGAKNRLIDAEAFRERQGSFFEETVADVYGLYEKRMHEANAMDFDDLLVRTVDLLELFEDVRDRYQRAFRWVLVDEYQDTNKAQYRMLQLLAGESRNLTVVGRRQPVDLSASAAPTSATSSTSRRTIPTPRSSSSSRTTARPGRSSTRANAVIANNREQKPKQPVDRGGARRPDHDRRARRRARGGALRRRRGRAAVHGRGDRPRRGRGLLPGQRAEPGARGHAGPLRAALPGDRRHQVLRPGRDQGRGRLPPVPREPGRRRLVPADRQLAPARDRRPDAGAAALAREHDRDRRLGRDPRGGTRSGARHRAAAGGAPVRRHDGRAARPGRRHEAWPSCSTPCCARPATWRRSRPSARSRPRAGSRTSRS